MQIQRCNFGTEGTFKYETKQECYCFPLHIHQFFELVWLMDGEMEITVNKVTETIKSGQFALIFPFQTHSFYSERINRFYIYTFSPTLIAEFMRNADGKVGERAVFDAGSATTQLFLERVTNEKANSDVSLYSVLSCLYSMLYDYTQQVNLIQGMADNHVLSKVVLYMYDHFHEPITLAHVAHATGYSANYLSHCLQASFGLNYCSLLACIRVEHAKALLMDTTKSVFEIALESGFGSERSFHRQFLKVTGSTPSTYRSARHLKIAKNKNTWEQ